MGFGLSMHGLERAITNAAVDVRKLFQPCTYVEIGVAGGATLSQVAKVISGFGRGWRAVGVELPQGFDFCAQTVEQNCVAEHFNVMFIVPDGLERVNPIWNTVSVVLCNSADFFAGLWQEPIHLALIDGCHCKECVMRDFIGVERFMPPGGIVMLHDFDRSINDPQPHGGHCDVVGACEELGLLDNSRPGWNKGEVWRCAPGNSNMLSVRRLAATN